MGPFQNAISSVSPGRFTWNRPGSTPSTATFLMLYKARCSADYDPTVVGDFNLPETAAKIEEAERAIADFDQVDERHKQAFAVLVAIRSARR